MAKKKNNSGLNPAVAAPAVTAMPVTPSAPKKEWTRAMTALEDALRKLNMGSGAAIDLTELPLPFTTNITGPNTVEWKKRVIKYFITEMHANRHAFKVKTRTSLEYAVTSVTKAKPQNTTVKADQNVLQNIKSQQHTKYPPALSALDQNIYNAAAVIAEARAAAVASVNQQQTRSQSKPTIPGWGTPITQQALKLGDRAAKVAEAQRQAEHQLLLGESSKELKLVRRQVVRLEGLAAAKHQAQRDEAGVGFGANRPLAKQTQPNKSAEALLEQQTPRKPSVKAKLRALAALAVSDQESEGNFVDETQPEVVEGARQCLPLRPASRNNRTGLQYEYTAATEEALPSPSPFCSNRLSAPVKPREPVPAQQITLDTKAERQKKQRLAEECRLVRKDCIKKLSRSSPNESAAHRSKLGGVKRHNPNASLLGLPDKIQGQIYRMVLVKGGPVYILPTSHKQPALLRTCKQLRVKTRWIFENLNTFRIKVVKSEPVLPRNYTTHWFRRVVFTVQISDSPKWSGLKKWLKAYHERRVPGFKARDASNYKAWDVCAQAFEIVKSQRSLFPDKTFEEMEPMLEAWKEKVTDQQMGWNWE